MSNYESLMRRVRDGERILIDGATGTEVERRGVPQLDNAWNGGGALSHPDILREVHQDYIRQGAEIVISNTFATSRHALRDADVEARFEALNRRGVELAAEARHRMERPGVLVAGGISYWSWTGNRPTLSALRRDVGAQAGIMSAAGADLLMLEMMVDVDRMLVTLEAARASGLPVWVGLSCAPDAAGDPCLLNGEPLVDALAAIEQKGVPLVSIMHSEVEHIDGCLDVLQEHWAGPIGVYAHTGRKPQKAWSFEEAISPSGYASHCERWLGRGVQVIGGCCGMGVDHIAALRKLV